eukprot:Em0022g958a
MCHRKIQRNVQCEAPTSSSHLSGPCGPDELHLFLRVMDILLGNVIAQVIAIDIKAVKKHSDPLLGATIQKLVAKIQSCGVPFQIWKKDDNSKLDWT